jgi:hypothetical protein
MNKIEKSESRTVKRCTALTAIRLFFIAAIFAGLLAPSTALAAPEYIRCTVGLADPNALVVVGLASTNDQNYVQVDASACGFLISTGNWIGVDNTVNWDSVLDRQCSVPMDSNTTLLVWSAADNTSLTLAQGMCEAAASRAHSQSPTPAATTSKSPRETIAQINSGPHNAVAPPQATSNCNASATTVTVENQTSYTLTLYLDGPSPQSVTINSHAKLTLQLTPGHYAVGAVVSAPDVTPLSGSWDLSRCAYESRFYIS